VQISMFRIKAIMYPRISPGANCVGKGALAGGGPVPECSRPR
jgi:hypothetical protein